MRLYPNLVIIPIAFQGLPDSCFYGNGSGNPDYRKAMGFFLP